MALALFKLPLYLVTILGYSLLGKLPFDALASPVNSLVPRGEGFNGMGIVDLVMAIQEYLTTANAWYELKHIQRSCYEL